ncbi:MAG: response regulator [Desulfovibrio sp.]|nr:response regulator [Desulfovibrio sp.]
MFFNKSLMKRTAFFNSVTIAVTMCVFAVLLYLFVGSVEEKEALVNLDNIAKVEQSRMDTVLAQAETNVNNVAAFARSLIGEADDVKDPAKRQILTARITDVFKAVMSMAPDAVANYMTYDPWLINAREGVFHAKDENGVLTPQEITDIKKYAPDDIEHVGWYTLPKRSGKALWMPPYHNKNIDRWLISYIVPLYKNGVFLAVVGIDFDFKQMVRQVGKIRFHQQGYAFLKSPDGAVHYHPGFFEGETHGDEADRKFRLYTEFNEQDGAGIDVVGYEFRSTEFIGVAKTLRNGMQLFLCDARAEIFRSKYRMMGIALLLVLLATAINLILAKIISGWLAAPINRITDAVRAVEKGDYSVRIDDRKNAEAENEIGVLTRGVNLMAEALARQKLLNESELLQQNMKLQAAIEASDRASRAKSEFFANMSHDMRTPMNAIIGMSMIARENAGDPKKLADCFEKITQASDYLLALINDILDISRIESGRLPMAKKKVNVLNVIDNAILITGHLIRQRGHRIRADVSRITHECALTDDLRLQQVFVNILSNSAKYTRNGGEITIVASERPGGTEGTARYRFVLSDNGIGMSADFLKTLFTPFAREKNEYQTEVKGTGLGMAITKSIVTLMGGTIEVDSTRGRGTAITLDFELPLAEQDRPEADGGSLNRSVLVADGDPVDLKNAAAAIERVGLVPDLARSREEFFEKLSAQYREGGGYYAVIAGDGMAGLDPDDVRARLNADAAAPRLIAASYFENECPGQAFPMLKPLYASKLADGLRKLNAPAQPADPSPDRDLSSLDLTGRKILVVDDVAVNLEIAAYLLRLTGAEVDTAENGREAVDKFTAAAEAPYAIIFMDIHMPVMDGYAATRAMRASGTPFAESTPIVAMSANVFEEDRMNSKQAGMNDHIIKPIDVRQLRKMLAQYVLRQ